MQKEFSALKAASAATDARLEKVETDTSETRFDIKAMLGMMQEDRKKRELPAPPSRPAIMPPTRHRHLPESSESEYDSDEIDQVSYGPDDAFTSSVVTKWGGRRTSTPVACKGGSAAVSSSSFSSSERKDLSRAAGSGEMVVASKSKHPPLPLPETLGGGSRKKRSSSPKKLRRTGLIQCTDLKALVELMERHGFSQVPVIVRRTREVSKHFETAIANAYDICNNEAEMMAMLSADSGRSARLIPEACQIRDSVIDNFSPDNVAMFMEFFARMAENYNSRSDKGVQISGHLYSYVVLGTEKKICTSFLKYLHDN
jgi:hypothetical protein